MRDLRKELEYVERETNKIIELDTGFLYCRTSVDLNAIREKLQEFIDSADDNKDTVLKTIGIFEEIEVEAEIEDTEVFFVVFRAEQLRAKSCPSPYHLPELDGMDGHSWL